METPHSLVNPLQSSAKLKIQQNIHMFKWNFPYYVLLCSSESVSGGFQWMLVGLSAFEKKRAAGRLPVTSNQKSMLPYAFLQIFYFHISESLTEGRIFKNLNK